MFLPSWHSQPSGEGEVNRPLKSAKCALGWGRYRRGTNSACLWWRTGLGLFCKATFTVMPEEELMKTEVREAWLGEDEGHVPSREKRFMIV